jgi:hypothetical protein
LVAGVIACAAHDDHAAARGATAGSSGSAPAGAPAVEPRADAALAPDATPQTAVDTFELARRVCELVSAGHSVELAKLGDPSDLGFQQQWRDPSHHKPGPSPVRVLATGQLRSDEQALLARYTETLKAIASEQNGAAPACTTLQPLRGITFHGTGWAKLPDAAVYVAKDRSWGVMFSFGPIHGTPGGPLALRTIERWDADHCPAGRSEKPELCIGEGDSSDNCRCAK